MIISINKLRNQLIFCVPTHLESIFQKSFGQDWLKAINFHQGHLPIFTPHILYWSNPTHNLFIKTNLEENEGKKP